MTKVMRLRYLTLILIPLALLVGGCGTVTSDSPVGDASQIDPKDWDGTWVSNIGFKYEDDVQVYNLTVIDANKGVIRMTGSFERDGEQKAWSADLYLRRSASFKDYWLVSLKFLEGTNDKTEPGYYWGIARRDQQRQVAAWVPDAEAFKLLVESGALPGEVSKRDGFEVSLKELGAEHLEMIGSQDSVLSTSQDVAVEESKRPLFLWQFPLVFTRQ